MLIVFEGVHGAGLSSMSLLFEQYINKFRSQDGTLKIDPHLGDFVWTKEPNFPNDEAEKLNLTDQVDQYTRERLFFESRLQHQDFLSGKNVVCERYLWTGLTYAYKYSPDCFKLLLELYMSKPLFIQPDLYIFIDTPVDVCFDRCRSYSQEDLKSLRAAYAYTKHYIKAPVITTQSIGNEEAALKVLTDKFEEYVEVNNLSTEKDEW